MAAARGTVRKLEADKALISQNLSMKSPSTRHQTVLTVLARATSSRTSSMAKAVRTGGMGKKNSPSRRAPKAHLLRQKTRYPETRKAEKLLINRRCQGLGSRCHHPEELLKIPHQAVSTLLQEAPETDWIHRDRRQQDSLMTL